MSEKLEERKMNREKGVRDERDNAREGNVNGGINRGDCELGNEGGIQNVFQALIETK